MFQINFAFVVVRNEQIEPLNVFGPIGVSHTAVTKTNSVKNE